jgi:hypothetical protein
MNEKTESENRITASPTPPNVAVILQAVIERGVTAENVAVIEQMIALHERMEMREAERQYAKAYHALMAEIPKIAATRPVEDKQGNVKYYIAALSDIDKQLRPMASKFGFTYRWAESDSGAPNKVTEHCIVQHVGGHKEISPYTVRMSAPPSANDSQADVSTHQYARRGSLCDAFAIVVDHDDDARLEGKAITEAEAEDLKERVKLLEVDEEKFLAYAGAETYEAISEGRFASLLWFLDKREKELAAKLAAASAPTPPSNQPPEQRNEKGEFVF